MYKKYKVKKTNIEHNKSVEGETIEQKIRRVTQNKEPIQDGAPIIYTERKDGVKPEYDIRTDRFELAVEAMGNLHKDHIAKREERHKTKSEEINKSKNDGGAEPIGGTGEGQAAA